MKLIKSKKAIVLLALAIAAIAAVGAYAYWTTSGSGQGQASAGDVVALTVNQTSDASGLYPGDSIALSGNFDNSNAGAAYVKSVTATIDPFTTAFANGKPECSDADFEITGTSNLPGDIPHGAAQGTWNGLSIHMLDRADGSPGDGTGNQDNCKNLSASTLKIDYVAHAS